MGGTEEGKVGGEGGREQGDGSRGNKGREGEKEGGREQGDGGIWNKGREGEKEGGREYGEGERKQGCYTVTKRQWRKGGLRE